ncbi:MAG: hypothetical protein HYT93_02645 [Parcubacteria group bacterium]|nr:hypothetical protein [Parcubacteria group bacterium]
MSDSESQNKNSAFKIKKLPNSEVEIEGEVPTEELESYYKKTIHNLGREIEIPGFRKGHIPEKVLVEKVGENVILQEMAQAALSVVYPKIILENNIEPIGKPEITITKLARGNPLGFKAKTAVLPSFELPDYKAIAKRVGENATEKVFVEDKEVEDVVLNIQKQWETMPNKEGETKAPWELTDEFVKKLGKFETVLDFKSKIKENLVQEKTHKAKEKKRIAIIDAILNKIDIVLPNVLVQSEMDRMLSRFKGNVSAMGQKFEDYLTKIKKTEKELREGWQKDAEKGVKVQLLLQKIAEAEKIKAPEEEVQKEMEHLMKHHPKGDKDRMRQYIEGVLLHEKVFQFLENSDPNTPNASE